MIKVVISGGWWVLVWNLKCFISFILKGLLLLFWRFCSDVLCFTSCHLTFTTCNYNEWILSILSGLLVFTSCCCFPSPLTHTFPQWYHPNNPSKINNLFILETSKFWIWAHERSWDDWTRRNNLFRAGNTEDSDSRFRQTILTVLLFVSYFNPS